MSRRRRSNLVDIPVVEPKLKPEDVDKCVSDVYVKRYPAYNLVVEQFKKADIQRVICLGIGDLCTVYEPRYQFAFIEKICNELGITDIQFYDPALCSDCVPILKARNITVLEENLIGQYKMEPKTAFYIPHTSSVIFHNLLATNWNRKDLANLVIIGNSFAEYFDRSPSLMGNLYCKKCVSEYDLDFLNESAFSLINLMIAQPESFPPEGDVFWENKPSIISEGLDVIVPSK